MAAESAWSGEASYNKDPQGPARVLIGNWAEDQRVDSDMTTVYAKDSLKGTIWSRDPTLRAQEMHRSAQSSAFLTRDPAQSTVDSDHYATTTHSAYNAPPLPPSRFVNTGVRRRLLEAGIIEAVLQKAEAAKPDPRSCLPGRGTAGQPPTRADTTTAASFRAAQTGRQMAEDAADAAERVDRTHFNAHREEPITIWSSHANVVPGVTAMGGSRMFARSANFSTPIPLNNKLARPAH